MDPDANLTETLELAEDIATRHGIIDMDEQDFKDLYADANRLAELVTALNDWLSHGGWCPAAWSPLHSAFLQAEKYDLERAKPASEEARSVWRRILDKPHYALPIIQALLDERKAT